MDKKQAVKVITEAVKIYDNLYCNKNLLIIFGCPNNPLYIETKADVKNFVHLTGVKLNNSLLNDIADKNSNVLNVFYSKAMQNKLSVDNFDFKDGSTIQKMQVLINTLKFSVNAKMCGDYLDGRINLKTDKIVGSVNSFLGFIKAGKYFIPNTVMADDLRKNTIETKKVLAILSKHIDDDKYNTIEIVGKKIDIKKLLEKISPLVKIDSNIVGDIEHNYSKSQPKQNDNIKQIKFDSPAPQNIVHSSSGAAAAVMPKPDPLKNIFEKIMSSIKSFFKVQDKQSADPVQIAEQSEIIEEEIKVEENLIPPKHAKLIEARELFAENKITFNEYQQALKSYLYSLKGKEMWAEAADTLRNQLKECPDNLKKPINYEINIIERNFEKRFAPKPSEPEHKQTFDEIKRAAHEKYVKMQNEKTKSEKEEVTVNNFRER